MIKEEQIQILNAELNFIPESCAIERLNRWYDIFVEYNSHTNLMSKNDIEVLFEKHVFDSLGILKWDSFLSNKKILDVGCGGGFPSVILAVFFPKIKIIANDSRIKKINFIKLAKEELKLDNLEILYSRIEEAPLQNVDLIVSRAVGKIKDIFELSQKHLKNNGVFAIYKAKTAQSELEEFQKTHKNFDFEIFPYKLPLEKDYERKIIVIKSKP